MTGPLRSLGQRARRALLPEWAAMLHDVSVLRSDRDHLLTDVTVLRAEIADLQARSDALRAELDTLRARSDAHDEEVDENRRLSARVAELTDLVTEVVLPLHDREIDARRLRPDGTEPT